MTGPPDTERRPGLANPDAALTKLILGLKHYNKATDEIVDAVLRHVGRPDVVAWRQQQTKLDQLIDGIADRIIEQRTAA